MNFIQVSITLSSNMYVCNIFALESCKVYDSKQLFKMVHFMIKECNATTYAK